MAGIVPLPKATFSPGQCSNTSLPCGSPAYVIVRSEMSSLSSTRQHGFQNRTRKLPYQQLHHNEGFGVPIENQNAKTKERSIVRSVVVEMIPGESSEKYHPYSHLHVGTRWREIQGGKSWEGLLGEPQFDPVLRGELIRYGEFAQAAYDAFDDNMNSPFYGSCKYSRGRFFEKMGLENRGYEVTDYIYATAGEDFALAKLAKYFKIIPPLDALQGNVDAARNQLETNWIGYVAVTTDENEIKRLGRRDIVVVWRGTVTKLEWLENLRDYTSPSGLDPRLVGQSLKIEAGFLELYKSYNPKSRFTHKSARRQVLEAITKVVGKYADEELSITVCGHSLGSALAILAGYDIAESGVNQASNLPDQIAHWDKPDDEKLKNPEKVVEWTRSEDEKTVPVTVYSFGGPRVGNDAFRKRIEKLGVRVLRVVNCNDMIVKVPGIRIKERIAHYKLEVFMIWLYEKFDDVHYSHVGVPLNINNLISPFLERVTRPDLAHNLELYLHVLSGFHGAGKEFKQAIFRDQDRWIDEVDLSEYDPHVRQDADVLDDPHGSDSKATVASLVCCPDEDIRAALQRSCGSV